MRCVLLTKTARMMAGLLASLLLTIFTIQLTAQTAPDARPGRGFGPAYDAAHETTLNGTIQEVVSKRVVGSPAGIHLLVAGPQGVVDAHVGPFLSQETKESLQPGMPVRIIGATSSLQGKNYLLVRELTISGNTITVRSERGALLPVHSTRTQPAKNEKTAQVEVNGGAR
jgi:hypothetical protein